MLKAVPIIKIATAKFKIFEAVKESRKKEPRRPKKKPRIV
jgi:hypothetical protein